MLSMGGTDMSASNMSADISLGLSSAIFMTLAEPLGGEMPALKNFSAARPAASLRATVDQRKVQQTQGAINL